MTLTPKPSISSTDFLYFCREQNLDALRRHSLTGLEASVLHHALTRAAQHGTLGVFKYLSTKKEGLLHPNYKNTIAKCWFDAIDCDQLSILEFIARDLNVRAYKKDFLTLKELARSYEMGCRTGYLRVVQFLETLLQPELGPQHFKLWHTKEKESYQEIFLKDSESWETLCRNQSALHQREGFVKAYGRQNVDILEHLIFQKQFPLSPFVQGYLDIAGPSPWQQKVKNLFVMAKEKELLTQSPREELPSTPVKVSKI